MTVYTQIRQSIFCCLGVAVILCPLALFNFTGTTSAENRALIPFPTLPTTVAEFKKFTGAIDTWINDRIGLRSSLVALHRKIQLRVFRVSPSKMVALGEKGTAFLTCHNPAQPSKIEVLWALGAHKPKAELLSSYADRMKTAAELAKKTPFQVIFLSTPTAPLLRFQQLPEYLQAGIDRELLSKPLVQATLDTFRANNPKDDIFIYPLKEATELSQTHAVYPQKNFHWSTSPFTCTVADMLARKMGTPALPPTEKADFVSCTTPSDLSHLVGISFKNNDDLCPTPNFWAKLGGQYAYRPLQEAFTSSVGPFASVGVYHRNPTATPKKVLLIGDSFVAGLTSPLLRHVSDLLVVDYGIIARQESITSSAGAFMDQVRKEYKPDVVIVLQHNDFADLNDAYWNGVKELLQPATAEKTEHTAQTLFADQLFESNVTPLQAR